jgi:hypothetical protein
MAKPELKSFVKPNSVFGEGTAASKGEVDRVEETAEMLAGGAGVSW